MNILHGIALLFFKYSYSMIHFRMNSAISTIVSTIGSSAIVHEQATHFQGGTCTGLDKTVSKCMDFNAERM